MDLHCVGTAPGMHGAQQSRPFLRHGGETHKAMLCLWDPQELCVQDKRQAQRTKATMILLNQDRPLGSKKGGPPGPHCTGLGQRLPMRLGHPGNPRVPPGPWWQGQTLPHPQPEACPLPAPVSQ